MRTACNYLPQWLLHAAVVLPVTLSLHAASPAQKPLGGPRMPPSQTQDADPAPADPGANGPDTSDVPRRHPGSSIISFTPTVVLPPPDPRATLAPYISSTHPGDTPRGGRPGGLPPADTSAGGGDQPQAIPEPSIWLVWTLPVGVLAFVRRQRLAAMCRRR